MHLLKNALVFIFLTFTLSASAEYFVINDYRVAIKITGGEGVFEVAHVYWFYRFGTADTGGGSCHGRRRKHVFWLRHRSLATTVYVCRQSDEWLYRGLHHLGHALRACAVLGNSRCW